MKNLIKNTSSGVVDRNNKSVKRMDTVTDLLNLSFICIDKKVLSGKEIKDGLENVVEFVSLLFAGKLDDERLLQKHDIKFNTVTGRHRKEITGMAAYLSEIEEVRLESEARGGVIGEVKGIIIAGLEFGIPESRIISTLVTRLNISTDEAQDYFKKYNGK